MSLLRRLQFSVLFVMIAVLVGTLIFMASTARDYMNEQLTLQVRHAVDTLAASLPQEAYRGRSQRDELLADVFDNARLEYLQLTDASGKVLFERRRSAQMGESAGAPGWFTQLLPFAETIVTRPMSDGELSMGVLRASAHAGWLQAMLWRGTLEISALFVAAYLLLALLIAWFVSTVKFALHQQVQQPVERFGQDGDWQGDEASERWGAAPGGKRMSELRPAADAIHDMRMRVRATVKERNARIESLHLELNTDEITKLANRRYFVNALGRQLQASTQADTKDTVLGHVVLMHQRDLAAINQQLTRADTDDWLRNLARQLRDYVELHIGDEAVLARLNGSDLALLLPRSSVQDANRHAQALLAVLSAMRIALGQNRWCRWALAMTDYLPSDDVSSVFRHLDLALMQAENAGHGEITYLTPYETRQRAAHGQSLWRERILQSLRQGDFQLDFHHWQGINGRSYYPPRYEVTLNMLDIGESQVLSAYMLMPVAARVGLSGQCDLEALSLSLKWLEEHTSSEIVLRLSLVSLVEPEFEDQVRFMLKRHELAVQRLIVELDAFALSAQAQRDYGGDVMGFCQRLHSEFGMRFGLRSLTRQIDVLYQLGELACAYVKLGEDFIDLLHDSKGARELLRALIRTARSHGIEVVTMRVSGPEEYEWLRQEGVGALQLGELS